MNNQYKNLYDNIKTPENWKIDIKAKMKAEQNNENQNVLLFDSNKKKSKKSGLVWAIPVVGAAAAIGLVVLLNNLSTKVRVGTDNDPFALYGQLETKYQNVHFVDKGELLEDSALFGIGGSSVDDNEIVNGQDATEVKSSTYSFENGSKVQVFRSDKNKMPSVDESQISYIDGVETVIYEYHMSGQSVFVAYIELKGEVVELYFENIEKENIADAIGDYITKYK